LAKQCIVCDQAYPDFVDFCVADGRRLERVIHTHDPNDTLPVHNIQQSSPPEPVLADDDDEYEEIGQLFPKVEGEIQDLGVEFRGDVVLGKFDPEVGDVDVDLSGFHELDSISPQHAKLTVVQGCWYIEDLDSNAGVFVNSGPRIERRTEIADGDEITFGKAAFLFQAFR
jgi:hypothetical protein